MSNKREHLWIPEGEVDRRPNVPTGRSKDMGVIPAEHGTKLSMGLQNILAVYDKIKSGDSLGADDIMVFKILLPEGEKISNSARQKFIENEGLIINAVKDSRHVIVSAKKSMFERLNRRVSDYRASGRVRDFQYIDGFEVYTGEEKQSSALKEYLQKEFSNSIPVDIQIMLLPKLEKETKLKVVWKIISKIIEVKGALPTDPYELSDETLVIRAIVPMGAISILADDMAISRVEQTRFFSLLTTSGISPFQELVQVDGNVDINDLPIVAVLDSGIQFPPELEGLVITHWRPVGCSNGNCCHGTQVASKVIFANMGHQLTRKIFTPRARVIDCTIMDNAAVSEDVMIKRIQEAVHTFKDITSIFNLSANATQPIDGDEISIIGYELDNLMAKYPIQFVISSGNHSVWKTATTLEEILDDDETRIAAPADSMLGIAVGAIVGVEHKGSVSGLNMVSPYSRKGPGFAGFRKPDLVSYGATFLPGELIAGDQFSLVMGIDGVFTYNAGTSFTAPVVSGDLAEISHGIPERDILLSKALLYHGTQPVWDKKKVKKDEAEYIANIYGKGIADTSASKYSSPSKVTFIRTGELNRRTKERVKFYMPSVLSTLSGNNVVKVTVTCVTRPPVDRTKGIDYLGAYIKASLHKIDTKGQNKCANPKNGEGRMKWDSCYHFEELFSNFNAGDWEVWLELFSRWDVEADMDISYGLAVTVEELSGTIDIYSEIQNEVAGRFMPINSIRIPVRV